MSPELDDDHAKAICRVLVDHIVEFVVIGGMAARLHRTGHTTVDIDICPAIATVIRSKRTAGRPKDIVALPDLEAHARTLGEHGDADS